MYWEILEPMNWPRKCTDFVVVQPETLALSQELQGLSRLGEQYTNDISQGKPCF